MILDTYFSSVYFQLVWIFKYFAVLYVYVSFKARNQSIYLSDN